MTGKRNYRQQAKALTPEQAAYLAGIVDGEGYIGARLHRGTVNGTLEIGSVHRSFLDELASLAGVGSVAAKPLRNPRARRLCVWRISICSLRSLLVQLLPYLRLKKAQAELMLALTDYRYPARFEGRFQLEAFDQFKLMNKRGSLAQVN